MNIEPLRVAQRWIEQGHRVALATVVRTWNSAPRHVGSHMVIRDDGVFEGSVSGGCVEGAVVEAAKICFDEHDVTLCNFGVSDDDAWSVGLACGGELDVFVEPLAGAHLESILAYVDMRRPFVRVVDVRLGGATIYKKNVRGHEALSQQAMEDGTCALLEAGDQPAIFFDGFAPAPRLLLIGGGHLSQEVAQLARRVELDVVVVDPRQAFASRERFPHAKILAMWPDEAFEHDLEIGPRDAVLALSHDPKFDDPGLQAALTSPAFYVGALGSTRSHEKRLARLQEAGLEASLLDRIHAPIGLNIGAIGAAEIAVSIIAQIVQTLRQR